jgi:hypothetical protein
MSWLRILAICVWPFLIAGLVMVSCWLARHSDAPGSQPNGWAIFAMAFIAFFTAAAFSLPGN